MLKIKNLHVFVDKKHILKGVDLVVKPGEIHALMGPNGSGKSTLANVLMGHPGYKVANKQQSTNNKQRKKGQISLDGKSLIGKTPDERARMGLFLAFQNPVGIEGVSVQNFLRKVSQALHGKSKESVLDFRKKLAVVARRIGIDERLLKRSVNEGFSGGEKKKMEVLQLVIAKPKYAILDETDSGLDIDALKIVANGVKSILKENKKMGIFLITHYQRILQYIKPDYVHVLVGGKIVESGGRNLARKLEKEGYRR